MNSGETFDVPRDAFRFCRGSMAVLMWLSVATGWLWPAVVVWLVMAMSASLTVRYSPLLALYLITVERFHPSPPVSLHIKAMRFGHCMAMALIGLPLAMLLLHLGRPEVAWRLLTLVAVIKTIGSFTGCPATRMYACLFSGGTCCSALRDRAPWRRRGC